MAEWTEKRYPCVLQHADGSYAPKFDDIYLIQEAPGKISATADGWTADNTKASFLGMTAHWIEVKGGKWCLRSEVVGFQGISGDHGGLNIGRYFVGLCDRVGITSHEESKVTPSNCLSNRQNNSPHATLMQCAAFYCNLGQCLQQQHQLLYYRITTQSARIRCLDCC